MVCWALVCVSKASALREVSLPALWSCFPQESLRRAPSVGSTRLNARPFSTTSGSFHRQAGSLPGAHACTVPGGLRDPSGNADTGGGCPTIAHSERTLSQKYFWPI